MESEGISAVHAFIEAFNNQNRDALARTLNYPHVRLANGRYFTVDSQERFRELRARGKFVHGYLS